MNNLKKHVSQKIATFHLFHPPGKMNSSPFELRKTLTLKSKTIINTIEEEQECADFKSPYEDISFQYGFRNNFILQNTPREEFTRAEEIARIHQDQCLRDSSDLSESIQGDQIGGSVSEFYIGTSRLRNRRSGFEDLRSLDTPSHLRR